MIIYWSGISSNKLSPNCQWKFRIFFQRCTPIVTNLSTFFPTCCSALNSTPLANFSLLAKGGGVGRLCIAHFCWRCKDWLKKIRQAAKPLPPHPPIHHLIHTSGLHPSGFVQESSPINRGISYSLYMREILPNLSHVSIGFSKSRYWKYTFRVLVFVAKKSILFLTVQQIYSIVYSWKKISWNFSKK